MQVRLHYLSHLLLFVHCGSIDFNRWYIKTLIKINCRKKARIIRAKEHSFLFVKQNYFAEWANTATLSTADLILSYTSAGPGKEICLVPL